LDEQHAFTSIPLDPQPAKLHRREAARLRGLATAATTEKMRQNLEDRAREHDRLAGDLMSILETV
jgi:hypothetical protein